MFVATKNWYFWREVSTSAVAFVVMKPGVFNETFKAEWWLPLVRLFVWLHTLNDLNTKVNNTKWVSQLCSWRSKVRRMVRKHDSAGFILLLLSYMFSKMLFVPKNIEWELPSVLIISRNHNFAFYTTFFVTGFSLKPHQKVRLQPWQTKRW